MYYICRNVTELPEYMFLKIRVPEDIEISAGEIFTANELDTEIVGNTDIYIPETIDNAMDTPVIILNGSFESLADGRRPDGNPNYATYLAKENEVISGIRLLEGAKFELGIDNFSNANDILEAIDNGEDISGSYLYPDIGANSFIWTKDFAEVNTTVYLYVETMKSLRVGGQYGLDFAKTVVARVKHNIAEQENKLMLAETVEQNLTTPLDAKTVVVTLEATGGAKPYTYEFAAGGEDNDLFEIEGIYVLNKAQIDDAKNYKVKIKATDKDGLYVIDEVEIPIDNPEIESIDLTMTNDIREGEASTQPGGLIATAEVMGGTEPYVLSLSGADANRFVIDNMSIKTGNTALTEDVYNIIITATDSNDKTIDYSLAIPVLHPYPEIESVTIKPDSGLVAPLAAHTSVGDIQVLGGTAPYTMTLPESYEDNDLFEIEDSIKTKAIVNDFGDKKIKVHVVDTHGKTKDATATISIEAPEITKVTVKPVTGLTAPVASNTLIANITTEGGTAPITYSLPAGVSNNDSFQISGSTIESKGEITQAGSYGVVVKATDSQGKTKNSVTTAFTIAAGS